MSDRGDNVTLGELKLMLENQNQMLGEIKADVKAQNGRVGALEGTSREHGVKITNLDREVFRARPRRPPPPPQEPDEETKGISRRDAAMFSAGVGALSAVVITLWKILPFLLAGPKP